MSKSRLHSEQIYQAMVDDEAFAELPTLLAKAVGARSCVIHWRDAQLQAVIASHSQYFSDAHMLDYTENFAVHDDWTNRANEQAVVNRVWNCQDLVPSSAYEQSIFYNEWIRPMGDDTFHCMGMIMKTDRGLGIIGLHRGRTQANFDDEAVKEINRNVVHLRRMLTVRARLSSDSTMIHGLTALLDSAQQPMLAVTARGRIIHANAMASSLIEAGTMIRDVGGHLETANPVTNVKLAHAVARASDRVSPDASVVMILTPEGRQLELALAPVQDRGTGLVLVSGRDPDAVLQRTLVPGDAKDSLAPRELLVARYVGMGLRNREIAERMGLTEGTVKVYLHNLFAKVGVTNRTELALLIGPQTRR